MAFKKLKDFEDIANNYWDLPTVEPSPISAAKIPRVGPLETDSGLYGGSTAAISQAPKKGWWEQHVLGGLKDLKKFVAPSKEDLITKSHIAPKPFETTDEILKRVGDARKGVGNNDLAGSSIVRGATFGLVRPQSLSEVPLNSDEGVTDMIGQTLGGSVLGPVTESLTAANAVKNVPVIGKAVEAVGDFLKPGSNMLVNWAKSGLPSAASNVVAGQLGINMDDAGASDRLKQGLTDVGASYALHLLHLPVDSQEASAFKNAPKIEFGSPSEINNAAKQLADEGNYPIAQKDLGNGELGITTKSDNGEVKLFKIAPQPERIEDSSIYKNLLDEKTQAESNLAKKKSGDKSLTLSTQEYKNQVKEATDNLGSYKRSYGKVSVKEAITASKETPQGSIPERATPVQPEPSVAQDVSTPSQQGVAPSPEQANTEMASGGSTRPTGEPVGVDSGTTRKSTLAARQGVDVEYQAMDREQTVKKARDYAEKSPEHLNETIDIANGKAPERNGVSQQSAYAALAQKAQETDDSELGRKLVGSQTLTATELGQRISLYGAVDSDNPIHVLEDLQQSKVAAKGGTEKVERKAKLETQKVKREIKDTPVDPEDWKKFTDDLPEGTGNKFLEGVKSGEITPEKLKNMGSSEERHAFLEKYVGKDKAQKVNALFESKTLLKNQQKGMINFVEKAGGLKPDAKREMIDKINRLGEVMNPEDEKVFLSDLVNQRLGIATTPEEAKNIYEFSKQIEATKAKMKPDFTFDNEDDALAHGMARALMNEYVSGIKTKAVTRDFKDYFKNPVKTLLDATGVVKAVNASLDNSLWGRQGIKTLFTNPAIWAKNFGKSFDDIAKTTFSKSEGTFLQKLTNNNVGDEVKLMANAKILSRKNNLNGTYKKMGLAIGTGEEEFPTALPAKIPLLGRLFKASENAYEIGATRLRADLADTILSKAKANGVDITDKHQLESFGHVINSLTGRGNLGKFENTGKAVNTLFFSPKFFKSNLDVLTAHQLGRLGEGGVVSPEAQKLAAGNLAKVVMGTAGLLATAHALWPNSVETDTRSSDFGKIRIGDTRFDVTGGEGAILTLAMRMATGESKSSTSGAISKLNDPNDPFSKTKFDLASDFMTNKLAPAATAFKDLVLTGKNFNGDPASVGEEAKDLVTPLSVKNFNEVSSAENGANSLLTMIADGLGISANTYDQGQSKPGAKGEYNKAVQAFVNGNGDEARSLIKAAYPEREQKSAIADAAKAAGQYEKHASEKTVDFYKSYTPVSKDRGKLSSQITDLIRDNKENEAYRKATDFNKTIDQNFKTYLSQYGNNDKEIRDMIASLKIPTSSQAFKQRRK